jgi:hypothetical protein
VPAVAIVSLKVAADPTKAVQTVYPGPGALSQLYVGPDDAGDPVDAEVVFDIFTVFPAHIFDAEIAPALFAVE